MSLSFIQSLKKSATSSHQPLAIYVSSFRRMIRKGNPFHLFKVAHEKTRFSRWHHHRLHSSNENDFRQETWELWEWEWAGVGEKDMFPLNGLKDMFLHF